jgi:cysteine desulfurase/selenocysteine lyase
MDLKDVRALFPGARDQVFLDIAQGGLLPEPVHEAAAADLRERMEGTADKSLAHAAVERSRSLFATLVNASPDEVAITKNVSEGLNLVASSLPWKRGDNVVLCPDVEHPNNVFLWYNLRKRHGVEVRAVAPVDGHIPVHAMADAMDARTRVVTVPSVSFSPGFVTDVRAIADAAHAHGALVVVDAAQSIGALMTDVEAMGADAVAVATQKCLLSVYGYGFLYVRRDVAEALVPSHVARYGMNLGEDAGETARSGDADLPYAPGARRFDLGNYNYLGARAAQAALELIHEIGVPAIDSHVRQLAAELANGFLDLGLPVAGGRPGPHLAHIVAVGESGGGHHDTADDPRTNRLHQWLVSQRIRHSVRKGVLRFSFGVYNDERDVGKVIEASRLFLS